MLPKIKIKLFDGGKLPEYKTTGAVCADCYTRLDEQKIVIPAGSRKLLPLGFAVELPYGYELVIRPRSGFTSKGIDVGIGTIDDDYRGEVMACVINTLADDLVIQNGERICQIAIRQVPAFEFEIVDELSETERAKCGFGSTGVK